MTDLLTQMKQATQWRGHTMKWNAELSTYNQKTGKMVDVHVCSVCGMQAVINTKPAPNEIDLGGKAVALNCTGTPEPA